LPLLQRALLALTRLCDALSSGAMPADLSLLGSPRTRVLLPSSSGTLVTSSRGLAGWPGASVLEVLDLSGQRVGTLAGLGGAALPRARLLALSGAALSAHALASSPPLAAGLLGLLLADNELADGGPPGGAPLRALRWLDLSHNPLLALVCAPALLRAALFRGARGAGHGSSFAPPFAHSPTSPPRTRRCSRWCWMAWR
jgi:hypothetical protein